MKLIIMRGLPGSGKSTRAAELAGPDGLVVSHDDILPEDRTQMGSGDWKAIKAICVGQVARAMSMGVDPIVVDNVHATSRSYEPYVDLATMYGYDVRIEAMHGKPDGELMLECFKRCTHLTPISAFHRMVRCWEA